MVSIKLLKKHKDQIYQYAIKKRYLYIIRAEIQIPSICKQEMAIKVIYQKNISLKTMDHLMNHVNN